MRETARDPGRLEHMLNAISHIEEFTRNMEYNEFVSDKRTQFAVIYNIQIIGEAAYYLTKDFKAAQTELPWKLIEKMRHVLVHDYFNIVPQAVWDVVTVDIPEIKPQMQKLFNEFATE